MTFRRLVFQESDKWKKRKEKLALRTQITATAGNYSPIYSREKPQDKASEMCELPLYQDCLTSKSACTIQYTKFKEQ
jgi:hypothetical protein